MSRCETGEGLLAQTDEAYQALGELNSPEAVREAERKISHLVRQRFAPILKHGCMQRELLGDSPPEA